MATVMTTPDPTAPVTADEADLVRRAAAGQPAAFARLVTLYQGRVGRLACRLCGRRDVEDVVQDVFVTALENLPRFRGQARFATWLYRITVSQCRRQRWRARLLPWRELLARRVRAASAAYEQASPAGEERMMRDDELSRVRAALFRLPNRDREVLVLRYQEDLPIEEIAAILAVRPNAVEVRLTRARARLRAALPGLVEEGP